MNWISVEEKLPESKQWVLTWDSRRVRITARMFPASFKFAEPAVKIVDEKERDEKIDYYEKTYGIQIGWVPVNVGRQK